MPSIATSLRAVAITAVITASTVSGVVSASAKTPADTHGRIHHVARDARKHRAKSKHARKGKHNRHHKVVKIAVSASVKGNKRKSPSKPSTTPAKPSTTVTKPSTTTPSTTTPTTTTPTTTTPNTPAPTGTAPADPTTSSGTPQPVGIPGAWNMVLDSEFNGSSYNSSVWRTGVDTPNGGMSGPMGTVEEDCYSPNNVTFPGDGTMHMNLTDQSSSCNFWGTQLSEPFTGSLLSTNPDDGRGSGGFQYTYGVLEARVFVPGDGNQIADWPAVWTTSQDWPMTGEDDVFEGLGGQACYHFHYGTSASNPQQEGGCDATLTPGWHTFASDWEPGSVTYYYDGQKVGKLTSNITGAPQYIVLDNTTGDQWWNGPTEADSMQVAYVRVWKSA